MSKTLRELVVGTQTALSMVSGQDVQVYADDRIAYMIQRLFNALLDDLWWPDFMQYFTRTLDGVDGVATTSLEDIKRYDDIRTVWAAQSDMELPELPPNINPMRVLSTSTMYRSRYTGPAQAQRVIQFWPKTATGDVVIHARVKPDDFTADDVVNFDPDVLISGAAFAYAVDDGTNPGAVEKFQAEYDSRLAQIKRAYSHKPIALNPYGTMFPHDWYVR